MKARTLVLPYGPDRPPVPGQPGIASFLLGAAAPFYPSPDVLRKFRVQQNSFDRGYQSTHSMGALTGSIGARIGALGSRNPSH